ncbi:MAG: hypothetical protein DCC67_16400 [Planctomycetota bacterium]|nr:MAG: hypothetical protein DCC67_16400 [Planctomycetota bacterium]
MKVERLFTALLVVLVMDAASASMAQERPVSGSGAGEITPTEETGGPWSWLKKPSFTMPKVTFPKMPADPLAPVKTSAKKVSDGTKKAWEGAKELFTFGGSKPAQPEPRVAAKEGPSVWQRMFGQGNSEPEGPQTVNEFLAQPRVE